jgi:hypothetical protein
MGSLGNKTQVPSGMNVRHVVSTAEGQLGLSFGDQKTRAYSKAYVLLSHPDSLDGVVDLSFRQEFRMAPFSCQSLALMPVGNTMSRLPQWS